MKQKLKYNLKFELELIVNVDYFSVAFYAVSLLNRIIIL